MELYPFISLGFAVVRDSDFIKSNTYFSWGGKKKETLIYFLPKSEKSPLSEGCT